MLSLLLRPRLLLSVVLLLVNVVRSSVLLSVQFGTLLLSHLAVFEGLLAVRLDLVLFRLQLLRLPGGEFTALQALPDAFLLSRLPVDDLPGLRRPYAYDASQRRGLPPPLSTVSSHCPPVPQFGL